MPTVCPGCDKAASSHNPISNHGSDLFPVYLCSECWAKVAQVQAEKGK